MSYSREQSVCIKLCFKLGKQFLKHVTCYEEPLEKVLY